MIAAASNAAFFAPASPIASVPTGIPPGICAVDKSESRPCSLDFIATSFQVMASTAYCDVNAAKSIVLIGMMGAGKSSVGRCLQRRTGLARLDTDEMLAAEFGIPIRQIFEKDGEDKFRNAETELL